MRKGVRWAKASGPVAHTIYKVNRWVSVYVPVEVELCRPGVDPCLRQAHARTENLKESGRDWCPVDATNFMLTGHGETNYQEAWQKEREIKTDTTRATLLETDPSFKEKDEDSSIRRTRHTRNAHFDYYIQRMNPRLLLLQIGHHVDGT